MQSSSDKRAIVPRRGVSERVARLTRQESSFTTEDTDVFQSEFVTIKSSISFRYLPVCCRTETILFGSTDLQGDPQKWHIFLCALTSSNVDQFSNLFHCKNQKKICNNTIAKGPIIPQVCHYTSL